ncbi:MAG: hypothetical protein P8Q99_05370 [Paracoccaceae bacterium]|nr:hypothetical protein [Paracoccaceae bacterium]
MAHALKTSNDFGLTNMANGVVKAVKAVGNAIADFFVSITEAQSRSAELNSMHALTDAELATKFGITRSEITAYVFRDRMF